MWQRIFMLMMKYASYTLHSPLPKPKALLLPLSPLTQKVEDVSVVKVWEPSKAISCFFEDIEIVCPLCHGAQFEKEVLQIKYKGYSIHELLKQSVEEAFLLFKDNRKLYKIFSLMKEAGLGYLMLHQPMTSLSSGELQRLQFVKEILDTRGKKTSVLT